jgi:hypothetical protein
MAMELAKVSLWLDAFTLGAPLSFFDHHLKPGNSLIGAQITDVQDYLRGGGRDVQLSPNGGFDAVVGSPPYSDIKGLEEFFHPLPV